jgi:hypothetical protein
MNGCVQNELASFQTKFLGVAVAHPIGTWIDGWQVVWCQPGRNCILWHVMVIRRTIEFRGCCDPIDTD